jgi:type IV pilus assembly protein PilB
VPAAGGRPVTPAQKAAVALDLVRRRKLSENSIAAAGFASLDALLQAIADQFRVARLELDQVELGPELIDFIPRQVAERNNVVAVFATAGELSIATSDPTQLEVFDWLQGSSKRTVTTMLASPMEVERAIRRLYEPRVATAAAAEVEEKVSQEDLQEATRIVDRLILGALEARASDIHIEATERETVVRYRVDGALRMAETRPIELHAALISRIKVIAQLDISIRFVPQDGRIKLRRGDKEVDLRVSILPTYWGEKVCCRLLDNSRASLPLDAIGFDPAQMRIFEKMIAAPYGLLLVTGPTGSGKSTTLYAALNAVRSPEMNVVSVEDPVEYQLPGINQVQVNVKRGLTFAGALRSILRQDPDVILVGEVRDHETGVIAAEAALTGHLVLTSLHTNDAPSAITRLTEMGIESYLVAPALVGVVAQRLLRRVCKNCAEEYRPDPSELEALGLPQLPDDVMFKRGKGCDVCAGTGCSGRIAIRELLEVDDELRTLISRGATADEIRLCARKNGFRTMRFQALQTLIAGITTTREVLRATRG